MPISWFTNLSMAAFERPKGWAGLRPLAPAVVNETWDGPVLPRERQAIRDPNIACVNTKFKATSMTNLWGALDRTSADPLADHDAMAARMEDSRPGSNNRRP